MSYLVNDPENFTDEMIEGFVAVHADIVRRTDGGVVRASGTSPGQVAVVIGGGSGHYPAFAGLVGPGLAHAAAMGNVFASPSAQQVYKVSRAAASDAGVLLSYGNYAGDVLNFDIAQERLRAEGIPTRTVVVTDDISSAPPDERHLRRGVAGDLVVFRAAAWAAEHGKSLDETWEIASKANERTRTLGVAFSGCTLPGADAPLFTVPHGRMAVGMGIHGEPGIEERDVPTARELADHLVDKILEEAPESGPAHTNSRVGVILNGLGSLKSEELFVVYGAVAARLAAAQLTVVQPEVGEFATSFEMAGLSLTITWLDEELEAAWVSPAATPGYRRGVASAPQADVERGGSAVDRPGPVAVPNLESAPDDARAEARLVADAVKAIKKTIDENVDHLGRLDSVAGDGDHGIGMQRGVNAAAAAAEEAVRSGGGARATLSAAADAWADRAGGTSGALWGLGLRAMAARLHDDRTATAAEVADGVAAARDAIVHAGKAQLGDKTLLDALIPFQERLAADLAAGAALSDAWRDAAQAATSAAQASADLLPHIGRARAHTQRSVGTPDPGAVSLALAVTVVAPLLTTREARP